MKPVYLLILMMAISAGVSAQLKLGSAKSEINLREGPGLNYKVSYTLSSSNLLVVLPRAPKNNFIEVFDIETNSYGFVSEKLVDITDTLNFQKQNFFEKSGENEDGEVEINMVNQTPETLYVWVNGNSYRLFPFEKKVLLMNVEEITFFSSAPGLFPVFGKEILKKGNAYRWNFSL